MGLAISILEELRRAGIHFDYLPGNWVRVKCPFHDDSNPSCDICTDGSGGFKCHSCGAKGDFISFLARLLNTERWVIIHDLTTRYGDVNERGLDIDHIEKQHQALWKATPLLTELYKRGITDDQIRRFRLGEKSGRIQIPITNASGIYVNTVSYAPGAPKGAPKFHSMRSRGEARLFPIDQLVYDKLMLIGGPIKAIGASTQLNKVGIGSICLTTGETAWDHSLNYHFKDKDVVICNDIDAAGQTGAELRCRALYPFAKRIRNLILPLDTKDYPKGDMNDFLAQGGDPAAVFETAVDWQPPCVIAVDTSGPIDLNVGESYSATYSKKRVSIRAHVAAVDQSAYHIPKDIEVKCDKQQAMCGICPIFGLKQNPPTVQLPAESTLVLKLMNEKEIIQTRVMQEEIGIPECPIVKLNVLSYYHVEDSRITPELDIKTRTNVNESSVFVPCICVDSRIELNETYQLIGKMQPHPYTQVATLVVSNSEPAKDSLSSFELEDPDALRVFQPSTSDYSSLRAKLDDIWSDIENRVTRIYGRRELHVAIDLAYFSTLYVPNRSETVKGWVEVLVVGDSSQGKSEATSRLLDYYGLGERIECKNASVAGLVGGVAELGPKGRRFVKWGVFPNNDRRLLVMEELKGLHREVFSKLTDMRSSGVAEIPKIERGKARARTRIVANSNPRSKRPVSSYNYGIDTILELIPSLEDIRRFDLVIVLNKNDVDVAKLTTRQHDANTPKYSADASRKLVLWAWTRDRDQIVFTTGCEQYLTEAALQLCETFVDDIPILDRGSTRHKLARLATAIAARTFSTDDGQMLIVTEHHARFAHEFILEHYSSKASGYLEYSEYVRARSRMLNSDEIINHIVAAPHARVLAEHLLNQNEIDHQDVCDWCGWDRVESLPLMSCLVRNNALVRDGRGYYKTPEFITLLQRALGNGVFKNLPEHSKKPETKF